MLALDAGYAVQALAGEAVSGDVVLTRVHEDRALLVLADGLGHGAQAAEAATRCVGVLAMYAETNMPEAFAEAHRQLRGGRGAVAAAVLIDGRSMTVQSAVVGNIVVRQVGVRHDRSWSATAVATPGVLGSAFRKVPLQQSNLEAGDVVIMHSDGVRSHFEALQTRVSDARSAAKEILASHARGHDDASCVVVRALAPGTAVSQEPTPFTPLSGPQVPLRAHSDIQLAATTARAFAKEHQLSGRAQWEVSIAAAELAQNAIKYGVEGLLKLGMDGQALVVEVVDRGNGFGHAKPQPGLREGLNAVKRMMDSCSVSSGPNGTRIVATKRRA